VKTLLATDLRDMVLSKAQVIAHWVATGQMAAVDPVHLFFTIWAATQTYADFEVQVCAVLGCNTLTPADQTHATEHVVALILRGCGLK
jgi:TetR/AcrR family transcriptional regulator